MSKLLRSVNFENLNISIKKIKTRTPFFYTEQTKCLAKIRITLKIKEILS